MGIWVPDDGHIVSLGAKGLSGMEWKDSIRGGILRVIDVNLGRKQYECR